MNRANTNLIDLLNNLRAAIQTTNDGGINEDRRFRPEDQKQPTIPNQKWHTMEIPEAKTVIVQNEINCYPKKEPCGYGPIRKGDMEMSEPAKEGPFDSFVRPQPCGVQSNGAFAALYMLTVGGATVVGGGDVPLNVADPIQNIGFAAPQAIVQQAGNYSVYYGVNVTSAQAAATQITVAVNGVPQAKTFIPILAEQTGEFSGKVILTLNADDVVTIRNVPGGADIVLASSPNVGAQLDLILLD